MGELLGRSANNSPIEHLFYGDSQTTLTEMACFYDVAVKHPSLSSWLPLRPIVSETTCLSNYFISYLSLLNASFLVGSLGNLWKSFGRVWCKGALFETFDFCWQRQDQIFGLEIPNSKLSVITSSHLTVNRTRISKKLLYLHKTRVLSSGCGDPQNRQGDYFNGANALESTPKMAYLPPFCKATKLQAAKLSVRKS